LTGRVSATRPNLGQFIENKADKKSVLDANEICPRRKTENYETKWLGSFLQKWLKQRNNLCATARTSAAALFHCGITIRPGSRSDRLKSALSSQGRPTI
jgi:hypothetical protein